MQQQCPPPQAKPARRPIRPGGIPWATPLATVSAPKAQGIRLVAVGMVAGGATLYNTAPGSRWADQVVFPSENENWLPPLSGTTTMKPWFKPSLASGEAWPLPPKVHRPLPTHRGQWLESGGRALGDFGSCQSARVAKIGEEDSRVTREGGQKSVTQAREVHQAGAYKKAKKILQ